MKKAVWSAAAAAAFLACASTAHAQLATANIQATVVVGNQARLTLTGTINFPDSDPDTVTTITQTGTVDVSARARVAPTQGLVVTVQATEAFFDMGTDTIPASAMTWTATGTNFLGTGTVSSASAANVASWNGPSNQAGVQTYRLANSWNYAPGTHNLTLTYTLATP
jgi:hypothetical protein